MKEPYLFDEFFSSGKEESISPFLTPSSRKWSKNLSLKSASSSAFFLICAFGFSFTNPPLSYLFLSFVYFLSGIPALIASLNDLKNLEINIDVLMTTAAFVAVSIDSGLEGALLLVLFELSHGMEHSVSNKARSALHNLNNIAPKFAHIVGEDGIIFEKSIRDIQIKEHVLVKHGEIVPLDGLVIEGSSSVNLVHLTGESIPVRKTVGDQVAAGARNLEGSLTVEVNRTSSDSTLARIVQLITQAQEAKPKLQRWLDQFGKHYATSIITLTFLFALTLPLIFSMTYLGHEGSVYRALAFLIAASPCALIIATPTAYLSAISASAKKGILLKGGITLDALANCTIIAFDKTGTLTTGDLQCIANDCPDTALSIAFGLERNAVHPIATAICKLAEQKKIAPAKIENFKSIPGFGLEGTHQGKRVAIGLPEFIGIETKDIGVLAALLFEDKKYLFRFSDQVRKEMSQMIQDLPLRPIILTGDNEQNAQTVAKQLGIQEVYANLRPADKLDKVAELSETQGLAMVGDGINDAPALARATVGISMGKIGSSTAVDASDVVLLNDDLHLLGWLFNRSKKTMKIVKQNLSLAVGVILFATTPALLGLVPLWVAVLLHEGGTVLVGLNSLRLLKK
ncbi:MAG: cadmium-translocating P-type ATPase [Chlamydiae bacterium CG10_big_fil_rev_8_21_14_0_10_42_34]|nr:MAG: cadmium-translocating P-type ATPase [Chlamydiae bacterium CG10_big_fil_rev_8_21_14_0_10_42_34]